MSPVPRGERLIALVWTRLAAANLIGALIVFVFFQYVAPIGDTPANASSNGAFTSLVAFIIYVGVAAVALTVAGVVITGQYGWVGEGRSPDAAERARTLREPLRLATLSLGVWLVAAVLFGGLNVSFRNSAAAVARIAAGIVFGGLATSSMTFLLVERTLRPLFAVVLAGQPASPERRRYLGVRPRLMLSWALGSGVPLFGIAMAVGGPSRPEDPAGAVAFLTAVGVVTGGC